MRSNNLQDSALRPLLRCAGQLLLVVLALAAGATSSAHVQRAAVTRILFNPNTHNIEVMHRFLLHDAEHAAGLIFGEEQRFVESADSRELFGSYVRNRFAIEATYQNGERMALPLSYVGVELDGQYLWVYQEATDDRPITTMTIVNSALQDVWPEQANMVNIEKAGQVHTLNFTRDADALSVSL